MILYWPKFLISPFKHVLLPVIIFLISLNPIFFGRGGWNITGKMGEMAVDPLMGVMLIAVDPRSSFFPSLKSLFCLAIFRSYFHAGETCIKTTLYQGFHTYLYKSYFWKTGSPEETKCARSHERLACVVRVLATEAEKRWVCLKMWHINS